MVMRQLLLITVFSSFSLLTACATHVPEPVSEADDVELEQTEELPADNVNSTQSAQTLKPAEISRTPPVVSIATDSLAAMARQQYQTGQYQSAIATAERGLRIDRRSASLYLVLAQSYMQLQMPQQAKNFTLQGLRYAVQGSDIEKSLLRIKNNLNE
jgi:tetratricopeptide (TPR) repeat protein